MKHWFINILLIVVVFENSQAQDGPVLTFNVPTQNTLQFNRFLINPTFSVVRENENYITMYHRNQWIQFKDSPELYMLSYAGKFNEKAGAGIGLYQQNLGIITSFGGIANYAYQLQLAENIKLAVGFNLAYYSTGVNSNRAVGNEPDPAILELSNNSILTLKPGFNVTWGSFDVGVYAENLVDYDFKSSQMVKEYSNKTFSAHAMYHHDMESRKGLFENGYFRLMTRGKINATEDFTLGGSILVNFPYLGWVQTGIDDYYGISIGAGAHLTHRLSLGYTYERVINEGAVNFGPTHEITLSFRLSSTTNKNTTRVFNYTKGPVDVASNKLIAEEELEEDVVVIEEPKKKPFKKANTKLTTDTDALAVSKALEIEKLRMTIDDSNLKFLEMIVKEDSIQKIKSEDFENRLNNMMAYIARVEKTAQTKEECNCDETEETTVVTETTTTVKKGGKTTQTKETKNDVSTLLSGMKSASQVDEIKLANIKNSSANEEKVDINSKLSGMKSGSNKETVGNKPSFTLNDDEIKEYYSKLTTKKRDTAKKNYLEIANQEPGFYVIANVFPEPASADNFISQLRKQGIKANYFTNPKNNFRYVYLRKYNSWNDALISYYTNVDNTYFDTIWIMNINIK
ncbi:PorP/SprF family type IX secretion system membrane protein [Flavobacterium sp. UBA6135]|uniref:PorP/SprF family type IX secretion system membrane protein n=1 Tax=Flavobacterium sp. UBA6135 TaxID=1946553 RepID=UPI0025B8E231|nr:PorP/SprF family type IX secretion system membrane protein [Flavobacterium sp. UBA6135]